jgi:ElaB/YqjD/DUF883 family membrane-anchored ribosome-binding protein
MACVAESVSKAASEFTEPIRAAVNENIRDVKRAVVAGRHAVEDCADATVGQVRRHPFASLAIAAGVGMLAGCVIGFTLRRPGGRSAKSGSAS